MSAPVPDWGSFQTEVEVTCPFCHDEVELEATVEFTKGKEDSTFYPLIGENTVWFTLDISASSTAHDCPEAHGR